MRTKEQIDEYLEIENKFKADDSLDIICGMTREIEKMLDISIYMSADMSQGSSSIYVENVFFLLRPFKKCQYKKKAEEFFNEHARKAKIEAVGEFFHNVDVEIFNKGYCYRHVLLSKCKNYYVVCYFANKSIYDCRVV